MKEKLFMTLVSTSTRSLGLQIEKMFCEKKKEEKKITFLVYFSPYVYFRTSRFFIPQQRAKLVSSFFAKTLSTDIEALTHPRRVRFSLSRKTFLRALLPSCPALYSSRKDDGARIFPVYGLVCALSFPTGVIGVWEMYGYWPDGDIDVFYFSLSLSFPLAPLQHQGATDHFESQYL